MQLKLLPNINSPADIRGFSMDELERLVDEIRFHTIDICDNARTKRQV